MSPEQLKIGSRFLVVLLFTALALPAWGASPIKRTMFGKVAIVAKSGGDYTNPVTAMANVALWCGTPSATNPCLVKIMPGVYDLAGGSLTMKEYVDIEGSGETVTIITSQSVDEPVEPQGVVNGANNAELRFLTVQGIAVEPYYARAIVNNGQSPKITHVTAIADATAGNGSFGVFNNNSSPTMSNVTVKATGGYGSNGVANYNSSPTMTNVIVTADNAEGITGILNVNSSPTMSNLTVRAGGHGNGSTGMYNQATSPVTIIVDRSTFEAGVSGGHPDSDASIANLSNVTLRIGASKLSGTVANFGTLTCTASYNSDYVALGTDCQPLP